jgi:hypothetical protein
LGFRLRLQGHHCIQVPSAIVSHVGGVSSASEGSRFARRYGTRNLMWCFVKCMPAVLFWPLLPFHVLALAFLMVRAMLNGTASPVATGIIEGLAGMPSVWSSRRANQRCRKASLRKIAKALTWNALIYLRRAPRIL